MGILNFELILKFSMEAIKKNLLKTSKKTTPNLLSSVCLISLNLN